MDSSRFPLPHGGLGLSPRRRELAVGQTAAPHPSAMAGSSRPDREARKAGPVQSGQAEAMVGRVAHARVGLQYSFGPGAVFIFSEF
jgi:hypothetical protein